MERSTPPNSAAAKDRQAQIRQILAILHKWGVHTLGQFASLDKEQIAARLGSEAVRLWERANGKTTRLLKLVQPPESFAESFEFENEIETAEPLLFMLRRFLQQLSVRLSGIYFVAKELTLRITFTNKQQYERCFKIPQPTNDVDLLFRMLQTYLENFKSEHPIVAVALGAQPVKPASQQFRLFETALRDPNQLSETLARLTGLLGTDRVGTPVLEETHRSDTFHIEPFSWDLTSPAVVTKLPLGAALRRFRPNVSASVLLADEQPVHLRSAQIRGAVSGQSGPYRASGNWWDEKIWSRSEWDLQLENNILVRCHQSPPSLRSGVAGGEKWEIDGVYD
jgi:protein ImuB